MKMKKDTRRRLAKYILLDILLDLYCLHGIINIDTYRIVNQGRKTKSIINNLSYTDLVRDIRDILYVKNPLW